MSLLKTEDEGKSKHEMAHEGDVVRLSFDISEFLFRAQISHFY